MSAFVTRLWNYYVPFIYYFLYWFISYYFLLSLYFMFVESLSKWTYTVQNNANWLYNHSYRVRQILTKGFKIASLVWGYWEKVWHYLCDWTWLKMYYWFPMRRHMDNLLNTSDVLITLGAVACGQLIEYLWRVENSRCSCMWTTYWIRTDVLKALGLVAMMASKHVQLLWMYIIITKHIIVFSQTKYCIITNYISNIIRNIRVNVNLG